MLVNDVLAAVFGRDHKPPGGRLRRPAGVCEGQKKGQKGDSEQRKLLVPDGGRPVPCAAQPGAAREPASRLSPYMPVSVERVF